MEGRRPFANRETTSLPDELDGFYGRDGDKEAIRSLLLSDDPNAGNLGVIPIVGMGGIGKTTLAQHVYNDAEVAKQFNIRGWICVSVEFTVLRLTKLILEEVTGGAPDSNNLNRLHLNLKGVLDGKKFLLVLDDAWSENYDGWNKLLTPLRSGAKGSKIIITTRSKVVASKMQTVPPHDLMVLEDKDCWELFARHACLDVNSAANRPELQEIGKEIVRKCRGLPLAAKALGGVLRCQTKAEKWKEVLNSEIWDVQNANILPSLALSYIHLPSHLRRCFAYCAMFPQDYQFRKEELVALWMSQSFIVQQKRNQPPEKIGDMYFDDLVSRSFFQPDNLDRSYFVMHDLVHDLARFVSGESCSRLKGKTSWRIGAERTRHLSYERPKDHMESIFQGINESPFLRSFVLARERRKLFHCNWSRPTRCYSEEVIHGLLPTRKLLRALSLSCYDIRELPTSIGNLKHMRLLDLSRTSIKLLPEGITALFNLEILNLQGCYKLVELPADMARLSNLRHLDLRETSKLKGMPPGMGKLKKLSKLTDFVVGENGGSSIKELGNLHNLSQISIRDLQNVKDDWDPSEVILQDKENLKRLFLSWKGDVDDSRQVKQVLERLQPHAHIENIWIWGYGGTEFPNWAGDVYFSKLKKLSLGGYENCICLPPLGQLPSLEELMISRNAVRAIGLEFYGMYKPGEKPFSSLKRLDFYNMLQWREWSSFNGAFPVLEELRLSECRKLLSVPTHLPSLKQLWIRDCGELDVENLLISTCATLETIEIRSSEKVKCISLETFPNLKKLAMYNCSNLESIGPTATTTTTRISDPLFSASNLKSMNIRECVNLKSLPQGMHSLLPSLEEFSISHCPEIESFPEGGLPSKLQSLEIIKCEKLVGGRMQWGLQSLPSLSKIIIKAGGSCEDVESSFPEETLLPSSLQSLEIRGFAKMKYLNYKGVQHLSSLKHLTIGDCENLESLPEEGLLSCLSSLIIRGCPLLEKRCEREVGEDWPKIKHIRYLLITKAPLGYFY